MSLVDRGPDYLTPGRVLADGRVLDVMPLIGGRARLVVSPDAASPIWSSGW